MLIVGRVHDSVLSTPVLVKKLMLLDGRPKTSGESLYTPAMLLGLFSKHDITLSRLVDSHLSILRDILMQRLVNCYTVGNHRSFVR